MVSKKPGEKASSGGTWREVGPQGGENGETAKVEKGETMPPTSRPGRHWEK